MGSGVTNFLSVVEARSLGTADIDKMSAAIDKQSAALDNLGKKATTVSDHPGFASFADKVKAGIENPLEGAKTAMASALEGLGPLGAGVAATTGIFVAAGLGIFEAAKSLGEYGTQIRDVQLKTGLAAKEVGQFAFAAKVVGQDISIVERMMRGLTMAIEDQSEKGVAARVWLKGFHVDMDAVKDGSAPTAEVLRQIGEGLAKLPTQWERNKAALDIFKKSGIEALPFLVGLNENLKQAQESGFGPSQGDIDKFISYQKNVAVLETLWANIWRSIKGAAVDLATYGRLYGGGDKPEPTPGHSLSDERTQREALQLQKDDADLDRRVKFHVQQLNEERKAWFELDDKVKAFEKQMGEKGMDSIQRIFAQRDELAGAGANRDRVTGAALMGAVPELAKMQGEDAKRMFEMSLKFGKTAAEEWDGVYKTLDKVSSQSVKDATEWAKKVAQVADDIDRIKVGSERSEIEGRSGRALSLANLRFGPGQEGAALNFAYQERIRLAHELYDFEFDHAHTLVEQVKAEADLRKGIFDAEVEREVKVAELQRKRMDDLRNTGAQLFDAVIGGRDGIANFAKNFVLGQARTVAGNVFADVFKNTSTHMGSSGTWAQGTIFGQDPLKGATDMNTVATVENTRAMMSFASVVTGGGGGGFSSAAGTFARMAGAGVGVEGVPETGGIFGSTNGDWAGETNHPAGSFSWGRAAGIGGAAIGAGFGIYSGISSGGARGALTATGSALAGTGAIMSLLAPKLLAAAGPAGMIAGALIGSIIPMIFGDPKQQRASQIQDELTAAHYTAPTSTTYTMDRYGRSFDRDSGGGLRVIVNVSAIDSKSFEDRAPQIIDLVNTAIESRMSPRFEANIRRTAFPR